MYLETTVRSLLNEGVRYCEAPYWTAYWLNFVTLEQIRCAQYQFDRNPYYRDLVDGAHDQPFRPYVGFRAAAGGRQWLTRTRARLTAFDVRFREIINPQFEIILPIKDSALREGSPP